MNTPTVLVIGAGASVPYGLPIGRKLVPEVAKAVAGMQPVNPPTTTVHFGDTADDPRVGGSERELADRIYHSRAPTIDEFILNCLEVQRPRIIRGMVRVLWELEAKALTSTARIEGDWLAWLFHRRLKTQIDAFQHNQLVVISFNYDRLPELLFATMMANHCWQSAESSWGCVNSELTTANGTGYKRFRHVHGAFSVKPKPDPYKPVLDLQFHDSNVDYAVREIETMGFGAIDTPEKRLQKDIDASYYEGLWRWADRILLLGLGYHEENLRKIGLDKEAIGFISSRDTFIGGTGLGFTELEEGRVRGLVGPKFQLGHRSQDSLSFLQEFLERG